MLQGISETLIHDIHACIAGEIDLSQYKLFFFGSRVTGTAREASDIDVGVMGDVPLPLEMLVRTVPIR